MERSASAAARIDLMAEWEAKASPTASSQYMGRTIHVVKQSSQAIFWRSTLVSRHVTKARVRLYLPKRVGTEPRCRGTWRRVDRLAQRRTSSVSHSLEMGSLIKSVVLPTGFCLFHSAHQTAGARMAVQQLHRIPVGAQAPATAQGTGRQDN